VPLYGLQQSDSHREKSEASTALERKVFGFSNEKALFLPLAVPELSRKADFWQVLIKKSNIWFSTQRGVDLQGVRMSGRG
jgi:hypothetical protein